MSAMELATETTKKSRSLPSYDCVTTTPERRPRGLTPSALLPKAALSTYRHFLARSHHGVRVTQAIGQYFHHMRRKMRRLLNEKVKPAAVDLRQARRALRHSVGGAWSVVNQRHLTKERARARSLKHKITKEDIHFA